MLIRISWSTAFRLLLCALVLSSGGCGASSTSPPPPDETSVGLPFPDSPDKVAANLMGTYERMDLGEMNRLLAGDYAMPLQALAASSYPDLGGAIERAEAMHIHERLFSQDDVTDPNGIVVPAVLAIDFQTYERTDTWEAAGPGSAYPGTQAAPFDVVLLMDRGAGRAMLKGQGTLVLHVATRDSLVGGIVKPYCELRAITDLMSDGKGTETHSLGRLLGLWR